MSWSLAWEESARSGEIYLSSCKAQAFQPSCPLQSSRDPCVPKSIMPIIGK